MASRGTTPSDTDLGIGTPAVVFRPTPQQPLPPFAAAGTVLFYDYRVRDGKTRSVPLPKQLKVIQWNIERGQMLAGVVETLRSLDADILILQELDLNCRRSRYINVPRTIAEELRLCCYFVVEFEELDGCDRDPMHAVGPLSRPPPCENASMDGEASLGNGESSGDSVRQRRLADADQRYCRVYGSEHGTSASGVGPHYHGNAILSKYDLDSPLVIPHSFNLNWEAAGVLLREPRRGRRVTLRCTLGSTTGVEAGVGCTTPLPPLHVYCCHFEVFCGGLGRLRQLCDVMADAAATQLEFAAEGSASRSAGEATGTTKHHPAFIVGGDLNTMAHGIVRLSPRYGKDRLRFLSLGETEAMWLQRNVLSRGMERFCRARCPFSPSFLPWVAGLLWSTLLGQRMVWQWVYGVTENELARCDNRQLCLFDVGDKHDSITLDNPAYRGFVRGKFDWLLLSNLLPRPTTLPFATLCEVAGERAQRTGGDADFRTQLSRSTPKSTSRMMGTQSNESAGWPWCVFASLTNFFPRWPYWRFSASDSCSESAALCATPPSYVLFNCAYEFSDHKGLLMTVERRVGMAAEVYPEGGAVYTQSFRAKAVLVLVKGLHVAVAASLLLQLPRLRSAVPRLRQ